ncbi:MAG: D-alanine--D-alanine ligase [Bacteriovorax sp.]|nr:D-alanine--D-alanine ligase [Bacteriovorax sp.]
MSKKNVLLLCGGSGTEHEVSLVSAKFIEKNLREIGLYNVVVVEIGAPRTNDKTFRILNVDGSHGETVEINFKRQLVGKYVIADLNYVVPCIHGPPGETGEIQTYLELISLPYFGCGPEASLVCFNKVTSKLWFNAIDIPNTPFEFLTSIEDAPKAHKLFDQYGKVFVKAASQGSSVGCYPVSTKSDLDNALKNAFTFSDYVLVEKMVNARELEISTYEFEGKVHASVPGEINCPSAFYSYEEKYNPNSKTTTEIVAPGLSADVVSKMRDYAIKSFKALKLRHQSRIDFFYTNDGKIYLNEINTFPGATPISMFPKMMENNGHSYLKFISDIIAKDIL